MTLDDDFPNEMAQSVSIQNVTSSSLYGPTFGAVVTYSCYVKQDIKNVKDNNGNDKVSSLQIYLDGHPTIDYNSKITYGSLIPPILKIQKAFDESGNAYATVIYT